MATNWFSDDYEDEALWPQAALPAVTAPAVRRQPRNPLSLADLYDQSSAEEAAQDDLEAAPWTAAPPPAPAGLAQAPAMGLDSLTPKPFAQTPPRVVSWEQARKDAEAYEASKPKPEQPIFGLGDFASAAGGFISALPTTGTEAFYRMKEGSKRPDQFSPEAQAAFAESRALQERMAQEQAEREKAGTSTTIGQAIREATSSSGYTLGSMGPAIAGGLSGAKVGTLAAGPVGGVVGSIVGGFAGSGAAAFTMSQNQFMEDAFREAEARMQKTQKRSLSEQEKQALYQEMEPLARDNALWEAGPEAVGNAFMLVGGGIAAGLLGKQGISKLAGGALRKGMIRAGALATGVGMEFATETATELGQALPRARMEAYLEGRPMEDAVSRYAGKPLGGAGGAFEEIWRPTLGTVLMFGLGGSAVKGVSKANERFRQNPQEAEAIVEMANKPDVLAAMPDKSLANLEVLAGHLRNQWFAGSKRQENMSEAIAKISAERMQRAGEDADTKKLRKQVLGETWAKMAPQEQSRVLDFFGATSPGLTGWETKEGAPTGQIDARALNRLANSLGMKGRELRQAYFDAPPPGGSGAPSIIDDFGSTLDAGPPGSLPKVSPIPTPGLSQVPPAQDPDIPFAPPAPAAGPTVTAADIEPDTVDVAGQPTVTVTSGMKEGLAQLRQQAAEAEQRNIQDREALGRQMLDEALARQRAAQEPPAPPAAPITPTPGETVQLQRGQEVILAPADPNAPVARSKSTPEDRAAIRERFGERNRKPKTPPAPTEVIPDAQEVQRQQAETETALNPPAPAAEVAGEVAPVATPEPVQPPEAPDAKAIPVDEAPVPEAGAPGEGRGEPVGGDLRVPGQDQEGAQPAGEVAQGEVAPSPYQEELNVIRKSKEYRDKKKKSPEKAEAWANEIAIANSNARIALKQEISESRREEREQLARQEGIDALLKPLADNRKEYNFARSLVTGAMDDLSKDVNNKSISADRAQELINEAERLGAIAPPRKIAAFERIGRAEEVAPAPTPAATQKVKTPDEQMEVDVGLEVVELADLITSDDARFPKSLQPRGRGERQASATQVFNIAKGLNPDRLLSSPVTSDGAPIVGPDNLVESGNGRVMAIRTAYGQFQDRANAYRAKLQEQGFDTTGMTAPVLIRRRVSLLDDAQRVEFTQKSNMATVASMSPSERANLHAQRLLSKPAVLDAYRGGDPGLSVNAEFVGRFFQEVLDPSERGQLQTKEGMLNAEGKKEIQSAILAAAYPDVALLDTLLESQDNNIKTIGGALREVAPDILQTKAYLRQYPELQSLDLSGPLTEAARLVNQARAENKGLKDILDQQGMFGGIDPTVERLTRLFFSDADLRKGLSQPKLVRILQSYAENARRIQPSDPLFDDIPQITVGDLLSTMEKRRDAEIPAEQADLLGGGAARPSRPASGAGDQRPSADRQSAADGAPGPREGQEDGGKPAEPEVAPEIPESSLTEKQRQAVKKIAAANGGIDALAGRDNAKVRKEIHEGLLDGTDKKATAANSGVTAIRNRLIELSGISPKDKTEAEFSRELTEWMQSEVAPTPAPDAQAKDAETKQEVKSEAEVKPEVSRIPSAEASILKLAGYTPEAIEAMSAAERAEAISAANAAAEGVTVVTPFTLGTQAIPQYVVASGETNAMFGLYERARGSFTHLTNLSTNLEAALQKAKVYAAARGETQIYDYGSGNLREIQRVAREQDRGGIDRALYGEKGPPVEGAVNPEGRVEPSADALSVDLSLLDDDALLRHFGLDLQERVAKSGKTYWAITGATERHKAMLDALGFKAPFKMDGLYWRSVFKENPKAKLVEALRAGGEVRIEPRPTLPRAEAETVLTQAGLVVTQNPNNPNRWTVEKHPQHKIRGGKNPMWAYKDLMQDLGGVFNRSSTDYKVTYRVFDYDPTEALGYAIANFDASGSAAGDAQAPQRGGNVHDDPRIRELRQRLDARDDRRLGAGEYRGSVSNDTQRLITEGGDRFHVPKQVQQEQIEDIGMIVRAFEEDAPAFILANAAGTGKTMVMGGAIRELRRLGHQKFVYVTQSRDLIEQIKSDLAAYGVDDVMFHTYAEMSGDTRMDVAGAVIFFDEAHNIKNINDNTARALKGQDLIQKARMSVFASATPFENPAQAQYLGATGLFAQAQAGEVSGFPFIDWAAAFGAEIETFEYIDRATGKIVKRHLPKWRSSDASKADAKASREWLAKQGILTQRPMRINPDMVDVEFSRTEVDPYFENLYNEVDNIYDDALIALESGEMDMAQTMDGKMLAGIAMHRENLIKRILEASKVPAAIQETRKLLEAGQNVVIFVETKADRALNRWRKTEGYQKKYGKDDKLYAYPEMQSLMEAWQREVDAWVRTPEELRGPYPKPPFADFIYHLAGFFHQQYGDKAIELPSTADEIVKAFGKENVGIYTGAVSTASANKAKEKFLAGELKILVATMAKGGTGLSLHDKVGNRPTTQLNINLPWTATQVEQVMARVARYGLQSKALVRWMFASNIGWEADKLAPKVGARMRDMGATVQGIDVPAAEILASDFDFTGTREIAKRQAAEEPGRMQEAMREAEDFGVVPPAQPDADQRRYSRQQETTSEFKRWSRDYPVIEDAKANPASNNTFETGKPFVAKVYHGSKSSEIEAFDSSKLGSNTGVASAKKGFFFAANPDTANSPYLIGEEIGGFSVTVGNDVFTKNSDLGEYDLISSEARADAMEYLLEYGDIKDALEAFDGYTGAVNFLRKLERGDFGNVVIGKPDPVFPPGVSPTVYPVYIRMSNPLVYNQEGRSYREDSYNDIIKRAKNSGHDGVVIANTYDGGPLDNIFVVFDNKDIKSYYNVGTYSEDTADIRYSSADDALTEVGMTQAQARAEAVEALGETNVRHLERNGFAVWLEPKPGARPLPGNNRTYLSSTGQEVVAPADAQAFVDKGVIHLIPSNMRTGALNALLHESAHLMKDERFAEGDRTILRMSHAVLNLAGLRNFIGNPGFQDLAEQVQRMAREGNPVALKALAQAQQVDPNRIAEESVAYLVEYGDMRLPIVRRILAAIRAALYRMGVKMELRPEDVRQLAISALKARAQRNKIEQRKLVRLAELERLYEEKYGPLALGELRVEVLRNIQEDTTLEQFRDLVTQMLERRYSAPPSAIEALRLLRDSRFVSDRTALDTLGEFPEYLYEVGKFIAEQRQKLVEGRLTPREVAKAYLITQSSIGSPARSLKALEPAFIKAGLSVSEVPALFLNERGGLRPEELMAWWLGTAKGQRALNALEQGQIDRAAFEEFLTLREPYGRDPLIGNSVLGLRKADGFQWGTAPEKRGDFNLANLLAFTGAINATQGDPKALVDVLGRAKGISTGKTGFIGHLLGLGNRPTVDAVEINFWLTGKADTRTADIAQKAKETVQAIREKLADRHVREAVFQRINQRLMPLANRFADQYQLPRGVMPHLLHHWLWDKAKGLETTHAGLYEAMRRYSVAPAIEVGEATMEEFEAVRARFQARQAETPFRQWFGKGTPGVTATVDGTPITLYHGTNNPLFTEWDSSRAAEASGHPTSGLGFFMTADKGAAARYGNNLLELHAKIDKPYYLTDADLTGIETRQDAERLRWNLMKQGYDGAVVEAPGAPHANYVIAFKPNQIKFTTNEKPTASPDMRYSLPPAPGQPPTPADAQRFLTDIGALNLEPQLNLIKRIWRNPSLWRKELMQSFADAAGNTRPAWTRLLSRQQIVEMLQESPIAQLAKHFEDTARLLDADKAEGKHLAFDIAKRLREAAAKSRDKGRGLYKLWFFTTLESVDPTQPAPQRENYGDTADYLRARQAHARAVEMLNELRRANPVLADLYKEVIVENKRSFEAYHQALKDRLGRGANGIFNAMMDRAKDMDPTATPTTLTQRLAKLAKDSAAYDAFTATVRQRLQQPDMKDAAAAALRDTLPDDAQKALFDDIVADVRGKVKSSVDALQSVYEQARVKEPYFPLSRWGDYQVYAEKAGEPKPVFAAFEREQDQRAAIAQLQKEGWTVKVNYDATGKLTFKPPADSFLGKMFVMVDEILSPGKDATQQEKSVLKKQRDALKDEFYQMYLRSLPDLSSRKHFLHRKGIPGFSMDALRGFAQLANSRANAIARLKHSDILSDSLMDMERALKRAGLDPSRVSEINRAGALLGELQSSYEWMMNPTNATWANRLTSFGFLWHLTNPSTALVNLTQVPIATFPDLAAKFGGGSAFSALSKAIKDYGEWKFHGKVAKEQAMQRLYAEFEGDLGKALKSPKISSQISRTEAVALAGMSDDAPEFSGGVKGSAAALYRGALYYGGWLYQKAEVANREITVIAAYRLARRKADAEGKSREQAHDYATEVAYNSMTRTQGDFSLANRAWFMRGNAMRVMFLFRSFSHMMTFNLLRDAYQSVKGKDAESKKLARARLAWTGAASLVFAGATGFPMYTLIAAIANGIWGSDPDDPWDFDAAVRDELTAYGGDTLMRTVMQGPLGQAPRALNLLGLDVKGVDIAPRVSLDLIRLWVRRQPEDSEGGAAMDWWMGQVAGPLYGTARGVAEGLRMLGQTSHDPQAWWRTLEGLTPAPIRNLAKAARFEEHGVTTRRGDLLMDEFGFTDLITQAIGFTPDELADQYRQNTRAWDLKYSLEKRRRNILSRYIFATEQGDDRMVQETMRFVERFNELNPEFPITFDSLRSAYRNFARARALSESGVYIPSQGLRARVFRDLTADDE